MGYRRPLGVGLRARVEECLGEVEREEELEALREQMGRKWWEEIQEYFRVVYLNLCPASLRPAGE